MAELNCAGRAPEVLQELARRKHAGEALGFQQFITNAAS